MAKRVTAEDIRVAIIARYIDTGEGSTVKDIAEAAGCSEATVRKRMDECHGSPNGTSARHEHRESFSRDYKGWTTGYHKVWVYYPDMKTLRAITRSAWGSEGIREKVALVTSLGKA